MKKAIFFSPVVAAIFFTVSESWLLMQQAQSNYIPVIFELMLFAFGYLVALGINLVVVIPASFLLLLKTLRLAAGIMLAIFIALIGTTVAYAFEIFGYRESILEPQYFYPVLIPLLLLTLVAHFYLRLRKFPRVDTGIEQPAEESDHNSAAPDEPRQ